MPAILESVVLSGEMTGRTMSLSPASPLHLMSAKASYLQTVSGDSGDSGGLVTFYLLLSALNTANIRPDLHHKSKYSTVAIPLSLLRIVFPSHLSASSFSSILVLEYKTNKTNKTKSSQ